MIYRCRFVFGWLLPPKVAFLKFTTTPGIRAMTFTKQVRFVFGWLLPPKVAFLKFTTTPGIRAMTFTKQVRFVFGWLLPPKVAFLNKFTTTPEVVRQPFPGSPRATPGYSIGLPEPGLRRVGNMIVGLLSITPKIVWWPLLCY